jgi:BirA family biotin operon repressor/biotin-[acetyl-CoA-carboxylase] ligase
VSIVLRPQLAPDAMPPLTMALGLAAAEALARAADLECDLRWPNDLMVGDRKLAGILVQMEGNAVIAGIGVNVNHAAFPEELKTEATSLRLATGRMHATEDLLVELLQSALRFCKMLEEGGKHLIFDLFSRRSSYAAGKKVTVDAPGGRVQGVTAGLDSSGFLRVRLADGRVETIVAGGVRAVSA